MRLKFSKLLVFVATLLMCSMIFAAELSAWRGETLFFVFIVLSTGLNVFAESEINNEAEKYEIDIASLICSFFAPLAGLILGLIVLNNNKDK